MRRAVEKRSFPAPPPNLPQWVYPEQVLLSAGRKPLVFAVCSDMYSPCLVFPYQRLPEQWYTLLSVFTHTCPIPPPGFAVATVLLFAGGGTVFAPAAGAAAAAFVSQAFTPP